MATITEPGIYLDYPIANYFADPCPRPSLTQSIAKLILNQSPAHAQYAHPRLRPVGVEQEEEHKKEKTIGDVAHKMILGRGKEVVVIDAPDWRTKIAKEMRDTAIEAGKVPILTAHATQSMLIVDAFQKFMVDHEVGPLHGKSEVVIAWQEDGFWFRSMIDLLSDDGLIVTDLKTTGMAMPPQEIGRRIDENGWDVQASMIERGLAKLLPDGAGKRTFRFISIEQNPPYGIVVNELPESVMTIGRRKLDYAIRIWCACLDAMHFPCYPPVVNRPEIPQWAEVRWMEREQTLHAETL